MLTGTQFINIFMQLREISPATLVPRSKVKSTFLKCSSENQALYVNSTIPELDNTIVFDDTVEPVEMVIMVAHEIGHAISIRRKGLHEGRYGEALEALKPEEMRAFRLSEEISAWCEGLSVLRSIKIDSSLEGLLRIVEEEGERGRGELVETEKKLVETEKKLVETEKKPIETEKKPVETNCKLVETDGYVSVPTTPSFLDTYFLSILRSMKYGLYSYSYNLKSFPAPLGFLKRFLAPSLPTQKEVNILGTRVDAFLEVVALEI